MNSPTVGALPDRLPSTQSLTLWTIASLLIVAIMAAAAVAGLLSPERVYPTDDLRRSFVANDIVDLVIGVPVLLGLMWLTRRRKLIGLLFWPGATLYVLYNHIAYVRAMPLGWPLLLHVALVSLSAYTTIGLVASIDGRAVQGRLHGRVQERLGGGLLAGLGILFLAFMLGTTGDAILNQAPLAEGELAVQVADATIVPAWIIGGALLWQRKPLGYVSGAGLLFQGSMLFVGLIAFLLLQPLLTDAPLALVDVMVVAIMGLVCFIPFALYMRGVLSTRPRS
ncbi:MAG: hypothetical protein JXA09_03515 [Anaerolineae bacterium]|nr:hypothetical protein [Anaerolineae bacterium]